MRATKWFTPWLLVIPAVAWVLIFNLYPFLNTIRLAFTNESPLGGGRYVGTRNFERLFQDPQLVDAIVNSLIYMVICLPLLTVLPLLIAVLVEKPLRGIAFFRVAFYTPVIASAVVVALVWTMMFDDRGLINNLLQLLTPLQEPFPFLTDRWLILMVAISLTVWKGLGYYMIIYLAALGNVGKDLHEAAEMDGAGPIRRFWSVTVPGVRGVMTLIAILIAVSAVRVFSEIFIITSGSGGPGGEAQTLVMLIRRYTQGFDGNLGYAAALSLVLFVITLVPMLVLARINSRGDK